MRHKTGQSYKVRSLLYSLWNGKPASLLDILSIDRDLRMALLLIMGAFGSRDFFYNEIKKPIVDAGLFDWFCEEGDAK
jgi:hypothetical protein